MLRRLGTRPELWLAAIVSAFGLGDLAKQLLNAVQIPTQTDYLIFLGAARAVAAGDCVYSPVSSAALGNSTVPDPVFSNPPAAAAILFPLTRVSIKTGIAIFLAMMLFLTALAIFLMARNFTPHSWPALKKFLVALMVTTTIAAMQTFAFVQWDGICLLALVASLLLLQRHQGLLAGIAASLLLIKPQFAWGAPLVFLLVAEWRALLGFFVGAAAWMISSLLISGQSCLQRLLTNFSQEAQQITRTAGIPGLVANIAHNANAGYVAGAILAVVVVGALVWQRGALRNDPVRGIAIGTAAVVISAVHLFPQDYLLLAPAIIYLARLSLPLVIGAVIALDAAMRIDQAVQPAHHIALAIAVILTVVAFFIFLIKRSSGVRIRPVTGQI